MKKIIRTALTAMWLLAAVATLAQTQKALTNADVVTMTKNGFAPALIVKAIQSGATDFDVSAQALIDLKTAGIDQSVMEAMLTAHGAKPSAAIEPAHGAMPPGEGGATDPSKPACTPSGGMPATRQHASGVEIRRRSDFQDRSRG